MGEWTPRQGRFWIWLAAWLLYSLATGRLAGLAANREGWWYALPLVWLAIPAALILWGRRTGRLPVRTARSEPALERVDERRT
jgi:hypothetical protein